MVRILNAIACEAHWVCGSPKVMLEIMGIQFAKTNSEQSRIRRSYWLVNSKDKFCKSEGSLIKALS